MQSHNPLVHKRLLFLAGWIEARMEKGNTTGEEGKKSKTKGQYNRKKKRGRGGRKEKKFDKK